MGAAIAGLLFLPSHLHRRSSSVDRAMRMDEDSLFLFSCPRKQIIAGAPLERETTSTFFCPSGAKRRK